MQRAIRIRDLLNLLVLCVDHRAMALGTTLVGVWLYPIPWTRNTYSLLISIHGTLC